MAEYYAVLRRAVASLDSNAVDARRAVYDKARNALIGQLKAVDPPLTTAEISRQRLELEEAIRKVEREAASAPQASRAPPPAARAQRPPAQAAPAEAGADQEPSAQDVFRRAIEDAQSRGYEAGGAPIDRPPPQRAVQRYVDTRQYGDAPPQNGRPSRERLPPASLPPLAGDDDLPPRRPDNGYGSAGDDNPEPRLAPEYAQEWEQPQQPQQPKQPPQPPTQRAVTVDRRDRPVYTPPQSSRGYLEEDDREVAEREPRRRSRLAGILLFVLIVGALGGLGWVGWSQRAVLNDLFASFEGGGTPPAPATPPVASDEAGTGKNPDRLLEGEPPPAKEVRSVDGGEATASADPGTEALPEGTEADTAAAPAEAGTETAAAPTSGEAAGDGLAQKAVLYEEPLNASGNPGGVTAINAAVTWSFDEKGANGPEVVANLTVPERNMTVHFTLHKNTDQTLPASHLIEVVVDIPADFPGKAIKSVPRVVMKPTEDARGQALVGAPAKVTDGFFWVALSAAEGDVTGNLKLLTEGNWIDLPFVYDTGQRAILTFEKGAAGEQVFEQAIAAWSQG